VSTMKISIYIDIAVVRKCVIRGRGLKTRVLPAGCIGMNIEQCSFYKNTVICTHQSSSTKLTKNYKNNTPPFTPCFPFTLTAFSSWARQEKFLLEIYQGKTLRQDILNKCMSS